MRYLRLFLALAACSAPAAGAPGQPPQQDGVWLQNGLRQYQRLSAHENLSEKDANDAVVVTSYICGVASFEKYLVQRADLLEGALRRGTRKQQPVDPRMLSGMVRALPLLAPLMNTGFLAADPPCDRVITLVREFLDQYPEMIDKDAGELVEKALLAAYPTDEG